LFLKGEHTKSMTHSSVKIQISSESLPSLPSWFGEVTAFAQVLAHLGQLKAIEQGVRFARARFGDYDTIDFVVVLIGYALSGEPTLKTFYERLLPEASSFMALFGRNSLPHHSTLSRFLAALDEPSVEALRTQFEKDLVARRPATTPPGGVWDRLGNHWLVIDVDGTKQAARQRALPHTLELPDPHRRFDQVCAPGYMGRKRGQVVRTRTTILQAHTHQWLGTRGNAGNGDYRGELRAAGETIVRYAKALSISPEKVIVRLDGLYGNSAPLRDILGLGLAVIGRSKEYSLLDLPQVQAILSQPPAQETTHPESGISRALFDCPAIPLGATGVSVRLIVAARPATTSKAPIGVTRENVIYELFWTTLPQDAFLASDVLDLYLHRGSFETVLADEDKEQNTDRWCSRTHWGQEFWQIIAQWVWNLRLELGHQLQPTAMRLTEFAPAQVIEAIQTVESTQVVESQQATEAIQTVESTQVVESQQATEAIQTVESTQVVESQQATEAIQTVEPAHPISYGPPKFAQRSYTKGFAGSDFRLLPDGTLRCPADHPLYPQERRPERDGSLRVLYAARIGHCRACPLRSQCQESATTIRPRRVSAVILPVSSPSPARVVSAASTPPVKLAPAPVEPAPAPVKPLASSPACPVLWGDWERCQVRRRWFHLLRTQTVTLTVGEALEPKIEDTKDQKVQTRAQRAHWRLSWDERLARNARSSSAPSLVITIHGLPATFAQSFGFDWVEAA
jgi:hypothetical protein